VEDEMPVWHLTVNLEPVWGVTGIPFTEKRDRIVHLIRRSGWLNNTLEKALLEELLGELAETPDATSFDGVFRDLYNLADDDRVWIETG
jgi:hypothetical protein